MQRQGPTNTRVLRDQVSRRMERRHIYYVRVETSLAFAATHREDSNSCRTENYTFAAPRLGLRGSVHGLAHMVSPSLYAQK